MLMLSFRFVVVLLFRLLALVKGCEGVVAMFLWTPLGWCERAEVANGGFVDSGIDDAGFWLQIGRLLLISTIGATIARTEEAFFLYGLSGRGRFGSVVLVILRSLLLDASSLWIIGAIVFCAKASGGTFLVGDAAESSGIGLPRIKSRIWVFVTLGLPHIPQLYAGAWW